MLMGSVGRAVASLDREIGCEINMFSLVVSTGGGDASEAITRDNACPSRVRLTREAW